MPKDTTTETNNPQLDISNVPKVSFISLGCPKNLVDSEVMLGQLAQEGFFICEDHEDADLIVINTCGFLQTAKNEGLNVINQALDLKKSGKVKGVIVAGCLPQRYPDLEYGDVDAVSGVTERSRIAEICKQVLSGQGSSHSNLVNQSYPKYEIDRDRLRITPRHYAYLRVAEGCNHTCSFCIIPQIRGRFRSKPIEELVKEAEELASSGAKELNLIAQDTTEYGLDIYRRLALPDLINELALVSGIRWIRLLYCYPTLMTDRLIETMATNEKVVKYIDMPIQHTSERMLRLMRRGITESRQRSLIEKLRSRIPNIFIRTTLIVGFPGETEEDFEQLVEDVKNLRFERLGTFMYSREEGTTADTMNDHIPEQVKVERYSRIMQLQQEIVIQTSKMLVGKEIQVIIDGKDGKYLKGRSYGDAPDVDCCVYIKSNNNRNIQIGEIVTSKITGFKGYDLVGVA